MKLSRRVARFNKRVTNRVQGLYAWLVPPWAVILHRGRRSGRPYRTPLVAFRARRHSRDRAPVRHRVGVASQLARREWWARDPCGAHLRRRGSRSRRHQRGGLPARTDVAPGSQVLPARGEARDPRARRAAPRLRAPTLNQPRAGQGERYGLLGGHVRALFPGVGEGSLVELGVDDGEPHRPEMRGR